ncbi:MAG: hypothetical protein WCI90_06020 [Chlorobium sp.]|nr:MAG: hypothetical protein FDX17_00275 [Chlorobium sp.]
MKKPRANAWSAERRARQSEMIQQWKPWTKSTGPRTEAGKAKVARNADKGLQLREMRELSAFYNRQFKEQWNQLIDIQSGMRDEL